jgi:UDPglucose 6-dehydrogenase
MIGFAGLSHLGLVSSIAAASKGFEVTAYDPDAALCQALTQGRLPVFEPDLPELLDRSKANIRFSADITALKPCQLIIFSQDVPTDDHNRSDLSGLRQLIEAVTHQAAPDTTLVILSQVTPGFTRQMATSLAQILAERKLSLFYQVETLIFGRAVERALYPERYIVGCGDPAAPLPAPYIELLGSFDCPILPMRYESAELAKISINMCLVAAVTTANTLAELCERIGADWSEIIPALKLDKRIGQYAYLNPGLGIAGGNLERDLMTVSSLAREFGTDFGVVEAWLANSRHRRDWALRTLHQAVISQHSTPVIALWGLAYKEHTRSTKNSPALALLESLPGFAIRAFDPQVRLAPESHPRFTQAASALEACQGADALVIMTPWPEFASVEATELERAMRGRVIIDPFGVLNHHQPASVGFSYYRLGRPVHEKGS